ncbi:alpha/beta fold hydrolase [Chloroflexota bacterium]
MSSASTLYRSPEAHAGLLAWYDDMLARLPVPYEARMVPTRYGDTHVVATGNPGTPPVVLVPGMGGNAMLYRRQLASLSDCCHLYAVDIPGQPGKSAPIRIGAGGLAYADWLCDVFDGLDLSQAAIIGGSMGGRLVLQFGAHPEGQRRIRRAVLFSAIGIRRISYGLTARMLPMGFGLRKGDADSIGRLLRYGLSLPLDGPLDEDTTRMLQGFLIGLRDFKHDMVAATRMLFPLPETTLRYFAAPTLLFMGAEERLFDPQHVINRAYQVLPNLVAEEIVPDMGHGLIMQHNAAVDARIRAFLLEVL